MKFPAPLLHGRLIKRYKRFLADIALDSGEVITASCPNTGAMLGLNMPGLGVWVSTNDNPARKYRHTLELVEAGMPGEPAACVGINTGLPNRIVAEAIADGTIARLAGYDSLRREVKYGSNSRIDLLLSGNSGAECAAYCYVEIKNVHLMRTKRLAEFPDSVTERGTKHLRELTEMVHQGHRAVMIYLIQRMDADAFTTANDIDPAYGAGLGLARSAGVEAYAYACDVRPTGIAVSHELPIV